MTVLFEQNSYAAYAESSFVGASPARLVTALYKGAIDATQDAQNCFRRGDIMGRSRAVSKIVRILTELMVSLDHDKGGEISKNLKRLYSYLQGRALHAHMHQQIEPLVETERILTDMIEAWYKVAESYNESVDVQGMDVPETSLESATSGSSSNVYGNYLGSMLLAEPAESMLGRDFSF